MTLNIGQIVLNAKMWVEISLSMWLEILHFVAPRVTWLHCMEFDLVQQQYLLKHHLLHLSCTGGLSGGHKFRVSFGII